MHLSFSANQSQPFQKDTERKYLLFGVLVKPNEWLDVNDSLSDRTPQEICHQAP